MLHVWDIDTGTVPSEARRDETLIEGFTSSQPFTLFLSQGGPITPGRMLARSEDAGLAAFLRVGIVGVGSVSVSISHRRRLSIWTFGNCSPATAGSGIKLLSCFLRELMLSIAMVCF